MASEQQQSGGYASKYAYLSSLYFVVVGVLYLWGYWPTFEVNILEYAGLTDIIKTAAYPIASFFVFFALGAVTGEFLAIGDALPAGGGVNTPAGRILRTVAPYVVAAYIIGTLLFFFLGPVEKWRVLPLLVALPLYVTARRYDLLSGLVKHDNVRSTLVFLLAALPFFAYGHGRLKAAAIVSGEEFVFAISPIPGVSAPVAGPMMSNPRYLGVAGGSVFFYMPERRSTIVVLMGDLKALELSRYKAEAQSGETPPVKAAVPASQSASPSPAPEPRVSH
jgi:hypothetical protein